MPDSWQLYNRPSSHCMDACLRSYVGVQKLDKELEQALAALDKERDSAVSKLDQQV